MTHHIPPRNKKEPDVKYLPSNTDKYKVTYSNRICFSFHYLNLYHDKFNIDSKTTPYFRKLMHRLKDASGMEKGQFIGYVGVGYNSKTFRCHPIEWEKTTEKSFGIPNEDVIVDAAYQFSISANEHGRIHGFFIGNVFYIVWLDPDHRLYSKRG